MSAKNGIINKLVKVLIKIYRIYHFYSSPTRFVIRKTAKAFFPHIEACGSVLEVGGGNAMMEKLITSLCRSNKFISTDIDATESTDLVCDAQMLPFPKNSFNLVVAFEVIEHIPDTVLFLEEINRVLKRGGYVFISVPFVYGTHDYYDYYRWTTKGLETIFNKHNLKVVKVNKCGGTFYTITSLISNYIHQTFSGKRIGWRSRGIGKKIYFSVMTVLLFPVMVFGWVSYFLDSLLDRDSQNTSGIVVILKKIPN